MSLTLAFLQGTGTAGGDRIEFTAINAVFSRADRERPLVVGSLKSCTGHLEACSGLASIVKTIQCLEKAKIPPQMHFRTPNPRIDFQSIVIPLTMLDWPSVHGQTRRAAVNSFGAGGTNAHAVLENYDQPITTPLPARKTWLFMVSAADDHALRRLSLRYAEYIELSRPVLSNLAHTLLACRSVLEKSIFFTVGSHGSAISKLRNQVSQVHLTQKKLSSALIFIFTGQGAQWYVNIPFLSMILADDPDFLDGRPTMGEELIKESPLFESVLRKCDKILAGLPDQPSWSIVDQLSKAQDVSNIYKTLYSQTLCTAFQMGIVILLRSWGILPTAVVGHSSGEITAAYTAGLLSFENAILAAYYRGVFLDRTSLNGSQNLSGSMCAVGMSQSEALQLLQQYNGRVQLAAVNSSNSCTLSGDADAVAAIESFCVLHGIFHRRLRVDMGLDSSL